MEKNCSICSKVFSSKTNGKYCSDQCKDIALRNNYSKRISLKDCVYCGSCFEGTRQERLCSNCKGTRKNNYSKKEVSILCRKCKQTIRKEIKSNTNRSKEAIGETCEKCLIEISKIRSNGMKKINPMHKAETRAKCASTQTGEVKKVSDYKELKRDRKKMTPEEVSERMKKNNPMHNKETRKRMSQTLKDGYATGRIAKAMGSNHWLWKGNRDRCQIIRTRLYPIWVKPILERDNFTCTRCGKKGGRLEVHHIEPTFKEIVEEVLNGKILHELEYEEFEKVSKDVLKNHANAIGITYCVKCHKDIDDKRR